MTIQSVKGLSLPTAKPIPGGNPNTAAFQSQKQSAISQDKLVSAVGGSRKKRNKRMMGGNKIVVPQYQMRYNVTNGSGQSPNNTIAQNAKTATQGTENAKYDKYAVQQGGKRKSRKSRKSRK